MKLPRRNPVLEADGMVPEENSGQASAAYSSAGSISCPQVRPLKHLCFKLLLKIPELNRDRPETEWFEPEPIPPCLRGKFQTPNPKPKVSMNTNMKEIWRCEITALCRAERKLSRARRRRERDTAGQIAVLRRDCERQVKDLERSARQELAAADKRLAMFQTRRAVLAGRISSGNAPAGTPSAN